MPLFCVETISTFRTRYIIECESVEHAMDSVVMSDSGVPEDELPVFSQRFVGEQILDGYEITKKQFNTMNQNLESNSEELGSPWMGEKQIYHVDYGYKDGLDQKTIT